MEKTSPPKEVYVLFTSKWPSATWTPVQINIGGELVAWADAEAAGAVEFVQGSRNDLNVNGQPYRRHRHLGTRPGGESDSNQSGTAYRLLETGYNVLSSQLPPNAQHAEFSPLRNFPMTRDEAESLARKHVTRHLAQLGVRLTCQIVTQNGREFGEPVATISGYEFTRQEGVATFKAEQTLPLTWIDEAGDAATPPAREDPPAKKEPQDDDSTDPDSGQTGPGPERGQPPVIAMVVRYEGTGAAIIPTGNRDGATCELVEWLDGRNDVAPDGNVKRLRDWLTERGYAPEFPAWQWLDKGHGPRRRREVYRLNGSIHSLYDTTIDTNFLQQMYQELRPSQLPEAERAALFRAKAMAGEGPFEPCRECPKVKHCPFGWGACDRKAEHAKAKMAGQARYQRDANSPGPWSAGPG